MPYIDELPAGNATERFSMVGNQGGETRLIPDEALQALLAAAIAEQLAPLRQEVEALKNGTGTGGGTGGGTTPTAVPAITYVSELTSLPTNAPANTLLGTFGARPAGVARTVSGTFVLAADERKVVRGAAALTAGMAATITVTDTPVAGSIYFGSQAVSRTESFVVTAASTGGTPTPTTPANPIDELQGARLVIGGSKLLTAFTGTPVTASGGLVSMVADQTAIAQNLSLGPNPNAPAYKKNGDAGFQASLMNGRPYLAFDGYNQHLISEPFQSESGGILVAAIVRRRSSQPAEYGCPFTIFGEAANQDGEQPFIRPYFRPNGGIYLGNRTDETADVPCPVDTLMVLAMRRNTDGTGRLRVNDSFSSILPNCANIFPGRLLLGNSVSRGHEFDDFTFTGAYEISDLIVTDALGDEDLICAHLAKLAGLKGQAAVDAAWNARLATAITGTVEQAAPTGGTDPGTGTGGGGTTPGDTTPSTIYDAFARTYAPATKVKPSIPTTPVAGVVFAPVVPQPSGGNDLQGGKFAGPAGVTIPARMYFLATTFAPGQIQPSQNIDIFWGGSAKEAQLVTLSKHEDDGTVDHALIISSQPAIVNGSGGDYMIRKTATSLSGSDVGTTFFASSPITGSVTYKRRKGYGNGGAETGVNQTFGMAPSQLLANAHATSVRYVGKLASERRYTYNLGHALRVNVDHTQFKDGSEDYAFEIMADQNRVAGVDEFGSYFADIDIRQSNTPVIQRTDQRIWNTTGWGKFVHTALTPAQNASNNPPDTTVQYDASELQRQGVIPPFDLQTGLYESVLAGYASAADGNFRLPYNMAGIAGNDMGQTGGRDDIGVLTQWAQAYFSTMDPRARQWVIAQAEAMRGQPANFYDAINKCPMNPFPGIGQPGMWLDNRGTDQGKNPPNTMHIDYSVGRDWDGAHQPMFGYAAYLITGRRQFGDILERQGCYTLAGTFVDARWRQIDGDWRDWCYMQENQPRQAGWAARDIAFMVRLAPDASAVKLPMRRAMNWNFAYLLTQVPSWKAKQGETFGWLPFSSPYGEADGHPGKWDLKAWMMDHYIAGCWASAMAGSENAMKFIDQFVYNFATERCMNEGSLPLSWAADYRFIVSSAHDIFNPSYTENTWSKLAATAEFKPGNGYWVGGNYGKLQMRSNVLMASLRNDPRARAVAQKHRDRANEQGLFLTTDNLRGGALDYYREIAWT